VNSRMMSDELRRDMVEAEKPWHQMKPGDWIRIENRVREVISVGLGAEKQEGTVGLIALFVSPPCSGPEMYVPVRMVDRLFEVGAASLFSRIVEATP
jgi:hypothetical protein